MPLDHYVTLGRSGLKVSPFCLGTMTFGTESGFGAEESVCRAIMDRYIDAGGNFIDTANVYTNGHAEQIIGDHVGHESARRDRLVIATKFSANLHRGDPNGGGGGRKSVIAACEASLKRLRTDYIDLYWQHWEDPYTPIDETLRALDDLVASGKVRYIGMSDTSAWKIAYAHAIAHFRGWAQLAAIQIEYSLLERTVEAELLPMARELGLGVTPWGPLRSGVLSGKYGRENMEAESPGRASKIARSVNERTFAVIDELKAVAAARGLPVSHVALAWLLSRSGVTAPILGARTIEQLDANLGALEVELTEDELARLDAVSEPVLAFPAVFVRTLAPGASYGGMTINDRRIG